MTSVKKEITQGVFWIALAKYSGIFISLGISAILARHIAPAEFGTMAVAAVVMYFLEIFTDMGLGPAIIQYKDLQKREISSLFMLSAWVGLALSLVMFLGSNLIAQYFKDDALTTICKCLCISLFFNALNIVPNALMSKEKRFRVIAIRTLFFQIISGCVAIWGALHGWGVYALVIPPICTSVGVFLVNIFNYPQQLSLKLQVTAIKRVASYSVYQFLFSFSNYFSRNLDKLIIGKYLGMTDLGYYEKSYRLMQIPMQNVTSVISPVLHPILSSLQNDKANLASKNDKLAFFISCLSFPIGIILFFCAGEIIKIIFGSQWDNAIPVFRILALSLPLQMILSTSGSLYQAAGKTNHMFFGGLLNTFVTISGFFISAFYFKTIEAIAWSWVITLTINFVDSYYIMYRYSFGLSVASLYKILGPQILNSLITSLTVSLIELNVSIDNIFVSLVFKVLLIGSFTFVLAKILGQYDIMKIISSIIKNRGLNFIK